MNRTQRRSANYGQKNLDRPHYVYRLFDRDGSLLYVGCSMDFFQRVEQHVGREFWPYVVHADVRGPWERTVALAIEKRAIEDEYPFFNSRPEYDRARRRFNRAVDDAMRADGWDGSPDLDDDDAWERYGEATEQYEAQCRITHPPMDPQDRLSGYLRSKAVRAA